MGEGVASRPAPSAPTPSAGLPVLPAPVRVRRAIRRQGELGAGRRGPGGAVEGDREAHEA